MSCGGSRQELTPEFVCCQLNQLGKLCVPVCVCGCVGGHMHFKLCILCGPFTPLSRLH